MLVALFNLCEIAVSQLHFKVACSAKVRLNIGLLVRRNDERGMYLLQFGEN